LNNSKKNASYIIASEKRPDGFLVFPAGHTPEVKGWLVWLLGGGHCNGVRPFKFIMCIFALSKVAFPSQKRTKTAPAAIIFHAIQCERIRHFLANLTNSLGGMLLDAPSLQIRMNSRF
jgi:hypothetical protein